MKRFILATSMFTIWLAIASTYYMCVIKGVCSTINESETEPKIISTPNYKNTFTKKNVAPTVINEVKDSLDSIDNNIVTLVDTLKVTGLKIYDQKNLVKSYYGNFKIYKNSERVQIPFSISEYGYVLAKHMDSTDTALHIKGYYNQEETESRGLERANFIKKRLTSLGIPEVLLSTSTENAIFDYSYDKFIGGIQFNFKKLDSVITLNKLDYTLFNNTTENASAEKTEDIIPMVNEPIIKNIPVEKEPIPDVAPAEVKKESIPETPKTSISFTVTQRDFKNDKFKASRAFKKFFEANKTSKSIQLMGYSNAYDNTEDNYKKGIKLGNLVNEYLKSKASYEGKTTITALKKQTFSSAKNIREGVTLIIQ